jgi:heme A synthase
MLDTLSTVHSFWRYGVLVAAVVGVVGALAGWLGALPAAQAARRSGLVYIIALDVQVLLGIVLWLGKGGLGLQPPFRLEHPLTMILAAVVAHVGQVMARRAKTPKAAARAVTIAVAVSLVLVVLGIPGLIRGG